MGKILKPEFFNPAFGGASPSTLKVAKELLGKFLVRRMNGKIIKLMITEVEAYDGFDDKASHASCGKTERNKIMFGEAGKWYVYFTYGMHWMLNIVTGPEDYPAAILIRGTDKIKGPARITKFLKIDKKFNGMPSNKKTGLWIEDRPARRSLGAGGRVKLLPKNIKVGKRVGVDYAGKWAHKPFRFFIDSSLRS